MASSRILLSTLSVIAAIVSASSAQSNLRQSTVWPTDKFVERELLDIETSNDREIILKYLRLTLDSLKRALIYFDANINKINLDGIIGPRQVESKLGYMVSRFWPVLPPDVSKTMKELIVASSEISDKGDAVVKSATPKYYANSYPLIKPHFYDLFFPARPINISLIEVFAHRTKAFTEKESDDCLDEFYGNKGTPKCFISDRCWNMMVGKRQLHYSLTHEVFYLLNGVQANCIQELSEKARTKNGTTVAQLLDFFCANVYNEALDIENKGFETGIRDLFMEQIGLCGDAGYVQIAKWRWLKSILQWQRPNGCFGLFKGEYMDPRNFDPTEYGKTKRSFDSPHLEKRTEQMMSSDGCLSHRISVAISALNTYVRRLIGHYIGETI